MPLWLRAILLTTAALVAAVVAFTIVTLPPRARATGFTPPPTVVYGAYHVHTTLSDGSATPEEAAAAAARAGLSFVILTDHGDATRTPMRPAYVHGVLVIDAVEVSTAQGHVVGLGLTSAAPYPLAGEGLDVIDDIHRLGGWTVVAHPDSPKRELRWTASTATTDGIEWLNADAEWRDETRSSLAATVLHYVIRPAESLATLFSRPTRSLQRWDADARRRSVVGLAGTDAHGTWKESGRWLPGFRLYEEIFRTLTQGVALDHPLTHDPAADAAAILSALRAGHTFSIVTALASPATMEISATDGVTVTSMGDRLDRPNGPIHVEATVRGGDAARVILFENGREVASGLGSAQFVADATPAAFRAEAYLDHITVPWIVSNPVYVGPATMAAPGQEDLGTDIDRGGRAAAASLTALTSSRSVAADNDAIWTIERARESTASTSVVGTERILTYRLGLDPPSAHGAPSVQYVALVHDMTANAEAFDRVQFIARANAPMRLSVQMRLPGQAGERWAKSVYLDETPRTIVVPLESLHPVGFDASLRPIAVSIHALLFVIDTTNAKPGTAGEIRLSDIRLGTGRR